MTITDTCYPLFGQRLLVLFLAFAPGYRFIVVALRNGRCCLMRCVAMGLERSLQTELPTPRVSARTLPLLARHTRG